MVEGGLCEGDNLVVRNGHGRVVAHDEWRSGRETAAERCADMLMRWVRWRACAAPVSVSGNVDVNAAVVNEVRSLPGSCARAFVCGSSYTKHSPSETNSTPRRHSLLWHTVSSAAHSSAPSTFARLHPFTLPATLRRRYHVIQAVTLKLQKVTPTAERCTNNRRPEQLPTAQLNLICFHDKAPLRCLI